MERVLIVDDDPDIVRLVSYNLSHSGYEVQVATSGREALDLVQKQPPDLVVLDVMLPGKRHRRGLAIRALGQPHRYGSGVQTFDIGGASMQVRLHANPHRAQRTSPGSPHLR